MARRKWTLETIQQVVEGEKPFIQVGYEPSSVQRKEGEEWTDTKGINWKIQNGAKVRVNKQADSIRELVKRRCSNCGFDVDMLGDKLDRQMHAKTGKCLDCVQAEEMEMICNGTYKRFVERKMLKNKLSVAKEFRKNVLESINFLKKDDCKIEMVHANGDITTYVGAQNEKLLKEAEADLVKVDKLITELEEQVKQFA